MGESEDQRRGNLTKKLVLSLTVLAANVSSAHQGTIAFGNSALTRVTFCSQGQIRNATAADGLGFYVFMGPAGATADALTRVEQAGNVATIGTTDGVMINAPSVFALPGTEGGQVVSLQIRGWDTATGGGIFRAQTEVCQVTLGPTAGPGAVIWQTATGTNPNRFHPLRFLAISCIPEPSTLALGGLGGLFLLLFPRKSARK